MKIVTLLLAVLAFVAPAAAEDRFYLVGSALRSARVGDDTNAAVTHVARFYLGDRHRDGLILCSGLFVVSRNENVLDAQLACSVIPIPDGAELPGRPRHHALAIEGGGSAPPEVDAVVSIAEQTRRARVCIVLSTLALACAEAAIPER